MDSELSFLVEQSQDSESSSSCDAGKGDHDFGLPETSKKKKKSNLLLISILIPLSGVIPLVWWQVNMALAKSAIRDDVCRC